MAVGTPFVPGMGAAAARDLTPAEVHALRTIGGPTTIVALVLAVLGFLVGMNVAATGAVTVASSFGIFISIFSAVAGHEARKGRRFRNIAVQNGWCFEVQGVVQQLPKQRDMIAGSSIGPAILKYGGGRNLAPGQAASVGIVGGLPGFPEDRVTNAAIVSINGTPLRRPVRVHVTWTPGAGGG